ncbi:MAG TPA: DUF4340 domain-containing protein [Candidatus Nitrosotalea sp.]|nr:DUF4340 domain-containing protein [Candidatus Nitrosotalea sp.]
MNSRTTLALLVLALGLGAYIFLVERPVHISRSRATVNAPLLTDFDPSKVTSIEILRSNIVIRVERTNGLWRLIRPESLAQSTAIENWLTVAGAVHRRAHITAKEMLAEPGGAAGFGIENPLATVTIQQGAKSFQLWLGNRTPVGDMLYVRFVGADGVDVTESALGDLLPRTSADWRDTTFAPLAGIKFNRVIVRAGTREFEVQRDSSNHVWRLTRPLSARADNGLLEQLLQQLQTTRITQFVSDLPGSDLEPFGLQPPEATITLADGTNNLVSFEFGKNLTNDAGAVFARRSTSPTIVAVPREFPNRLRAPYTEFRDQRLIEVSPDAVNRIEINAAETFALQKQTNGSWRVVEPVNFPADPGLVAVFFKRLNEFQIADVVKEVVTDLDLPSYGLAPPGRRYVFKQSDAASGTNQIVAEIEFGKIQGDRIFARRTDENSVYAVTRDDALGLPQHAFELHDRRIWQFTTNQVASMTITIHTNTWTLARIGDGKWKLTSDSQGMINPFALDETAFQLGQLRSRAWVIPAGGDLSPFRFKETGHKLSVQLNSGDKPRTLTVEFGRLSSTGGPFALTDLESGPTVFEFPVEIFYIYQEAIRGLNAGVKP